MSAKVGDPSPTADVAALFPQTILPSRVKGIPRLLRPYNYIQPDNTGHYLTADRLAQVKSQWGSLSTGKQADWQTWADANPPRDVVWDLDMPWSGQLAHAQCNMRLLFLGSPLRSDPPDESIYYYPAFIAASWSYPSPNQITVSWYELESASLTALISIRMLPSVGGLKSRHSLIPIVAVDYPDSSYTITSPVGMRCWVGLMTVHKTQGLSTVNAVIPITRGD